LRRRRGLHARRPDDRGGRKLLVTIEDAFRGAALDRNAQFDFDAEALK
jgi:hypothetical protein